MRGEHADEFESEFGREGSSPHARGAQPYGSGIGKREGIIPACAGSTP